MPSLPQSIPFELDRFSEQTRRRLYDLLRRTHFFVPGVDPGEAEVLPYSAEEAGLVVHFVWGRWLAVWTRLEVESARPEADKIEILRIKPSSEGDLGIMLHEC